ncbi:MAG: Mth938-like domain-containing protein [Kiloniellaceae bacterium]
MDVTPLVPRGRQIIESYGDGGFTVTGEAYRGALLVMPERTTAWDLESIEAIDPLSLEPVFAADPPIEVLLIGCGGSMAFIDPDLRAAAQARGVALEPMDTGAACRTYNVLVMEDRRVAAVLIAVD